MKLAVTYPDPEPLVVKLLVDKVAQTSHNFGAVTVGKTIPATFDASNPTQAIHIQVVLDGTPFADHPIVAHTTIRLVAWAPRGKQSLAIRGAAFAQGLLLSQHVGYGIAGATYLTGPLPGRDPDSDAEIAATTTRVTVRSQPI